MIKSTLLLCDYAQEVGGKLYIVGGGWSVATRMVGHLAVVFQIPYEYAQRRIRAHFSLFAGDGTTPVTLETGEPGPSITVELEVAPKLAVQRGFPLDAPMAIPLPAIELPPGRYEWQLTIEGEHAVSSVPFLIVGSSDSPAAADMPQPDGVGR